MAIKSLVSIDGWDFPMPSTYKGSTATLVDSARNVQGKMVGSVIRDDVAKIEMTWRFLSVKDWSNIMKQFDKKSGGRFINNVTFFNQTTGAYTTREMYVGDRNAEVFHVTENGVEGWLNPAIHLIEV